MADSPEDRVAESRWISGYSLRQVIGNDVSREVSRMGSAGYFGEGARSSNPSLAGLRRTGKLYRVDDIEMLRGLFSKQEIADEYGEPWDAAGKEKVEWGRFDRVVKVKNEGVGVNVVDVLREAMDAKRVVVDIDLSKIGDRETILQIAKAGGVELVRNLWTSPDASVELRVGSKKRSPTMTLRSGDEYITLTVANWERVLGGVGREIKLPATKGNVHDVAGDWAIALKSLDIPGANREPRRLMAKSIGVYKGAERVV